MASLFVKCLHKEAERELVLGGDDIDLVGSVLFNSRPLLLLSEALTPSISRAAPLLPPT